MRDGGVSLHTEAFHFLTPENAIRYWAGYSLDGGEIPANEDFCKYQIANEAWQEKLQQVAKDAYLALEGTGYGRGTFLCEEQ